MGRMKILPLLALPMVVTTCGGEQTLQGECANNDFGGGTVGIKIQTLVQASTALVNAAREITDDTLGACRNMATELQIPGSELQVPAEMANTPGAEIRVVCTKVKAKIDEIIQSLKAEVKVTVVATPAVCTLNAEFQHKCVETCEQKTITETELMCKPGKLSGTCSAMCTGSCSGSCSAGCRGECSATCRGKCTGRISGKCMGTCTGSCDGMCSAMNAQGQCTGTCTGTCSGTCSAEVEAQCEGKCEGSCSASCRGECTGSCMGTCTGGCNVMFQAPYCEEVEVTKMVTECERSCETRARAEAKCTEPMLTVVVQTNLAEERMKAQRLIAALKVGLPKLLKTIARAGGTVQTSFGAFVEATRGLGSAIVNHSAQATKCIGASVESSARAFASISVSVEVSVSVQGSAYARAGS